MRKLIELLPVSYALKQSFKKKYGLSTFKSDIAAALIVSLVALPLAMALAIAVGLPPQHGLYTAIVAGMIVPLLGGSLFQISGPTAAFVVVIAPIITEHGLRGLVLSTFLAGFLLILLGMAKLGRYIKYVPYSVTTGFTSGIAVVIGTLALNDFLGLHIDALQGDYLHKITLIFQHFPSLSWPEAFVGIISLIIMISSGQIFPKIPSPLLGIIGGTLLCFLLTKNGLEVETIGSRFSYLLPNGTIGHGIPSFPPVFHIPGIDGSALFAWPSMIEVKILMGSVFVIATLAALETLLSATVADNMSGTKHHPNAELIGLGVGNLLCALSLGIPATGAIARTATNIQSGAKTPIASSLHALFILIYVLLLAPMMSYVPMASLSALLIMVAYHMSHWKQFKRIIEIAPRSDSCVLFTCFILTVFIDMVAGVTAGILLSCFLLIKQLAKLTQTEISHSSTKKNHKIKHLTLPDHVMVYHINGALFFASVENALDHSYFFGKNIHTLIIDMENVPFIDITGLVTMKSFIMERQNQNLVVILCGHHNVTDKILKKLSIESKNKIKTFETIEKSIAFISS